jgi:hypothetical protein
MNMAGALLAKDKIEKATVRKQTNGLLKQNLLKKIMKFPPFVWINNLALVPKFSPLVKVKFHERLGDHSLKRTRRPVRTILMMYRSLSLPPIPLLFAVDASTIVLPIQAHSLGLVNPFLPPFSKILIVKRD